MMDNHTTYIWKSDHLASPTPATRTPNSPTPYAAAESVSSAADTATCETRTDAQAMAIGLSFMVWLRFLGWIMFMRLDCVQFCGGHLPCLCAGLIMCSHFRNPPLAEMSSSMTVIKNYLTLRRCFFMMNLSRPAGLIDALFIFFIDRSKTKQQRWRTRPIWAPVGRRSTPTTPTTKVRIYASHILFEFGADQFISHAHSFV